MHPLFILLVGVVGICAAQSFDLRKIPDRVSQKALEALTRFRAAYAEFLRTHPNATLAKRTKPERILNPPDIEREIGLTPVRSALRSTSVLMLLVVLCLLTITVCTCMQIQTIRYRGFPGEEHTHQTADGYINTLFRIPYGRSGPDHNPIGARHSDASNEYCMLSRE